MPNPVERNILTYLLILIIIFFNYWPNVLGFLPTLILFQPNFLLTPALSIIVQCDLRILIPVNVLSDWPLHVLKHVTSRLVTLTNHPEIRNNLFLN